MDAHQNAFGHTHLRLFSPENDAQDSGGDLSPATSLSEFYSQAFVPLWIEARQLDSKTQVAYDQSIALWKGLTGDPSLAHIDDFTCASFVVALGKQPGRKREFMTSTTINKHCRQLNKVLRFTGRRGYDKPNRKNIGILDMPPIIEEPAPEKPPPRDFSIQELHALYRAAEKMNRPNHLEGVQPGDWWRALLVVSYYTGLRRNHLMSISIPRIEDWCEGARVVVDALRGKKKAGYRKYLPPNAMDHVQRIKTDRRWLFDYPNWPASYSNLNRHFAALLEHAGFDPSQKPKLHGIRASHLTQLAGIDPLKFHRTAQQSAGHQSLDTSMESYINETSTEAAMARAIQLMPCPVPNQ